VAWLGLAWRGMALRGVAWPWRGTTPAGGPAKDRAGAAQDAGGPQGPPAALRRATASTGRAPNYHDITRMIMILRVAWRGMVWRGVAWRGVEWCGVGSVARRGVAVAGVAWRGVAWRGVACRGVAWRGRQTDRLGLADIGRTPPAGGPAKYRAGAAQDAGGPQGPPAALHRAQATASTGRALHYHHDVTRMIMMMIRVRQLES
jgi:hypothetical protein